MEIKNSVSNDFRSTFVDSINVFDCCLYDVIILYRKRGLVALHCVYAVVWMSVSLPHGAMGLPVIFESGGS